MARIAVNGRFLRYRITGVQRYARELVRALMPVLAGRGDDLVVLAPASRLEQPDADAPVIRAGGPLGDYLWEQLILPRMFRRARADLLWSPCNLGPVSVASQVVTIHDAAVLAHREWFKPWFAWTYRRLLPRLGRVAQRVVTDSQFSATELVAYGIADPAKIRVVHAGVTTRPAGERGSRLSARPYILTVSSLEPRKNLDRLFAAWSRVAQTAALESYQLLVVGAEGPVFAGRRGKLPPPPRTTFLGYIGDEALYEYYRGAHAFVYVSLYEGFGLPPLDALHWGVPVLAADIPSLREACGDAALFCNPLSVDEIADGLIRVAIDDAVRSQLAARGRTRAAQFTWERAARQLAAVFAEVVGPAQRRARSIA